MDSRKTKDATEPAGFGGSAYPLAGVLLDVHGLDERLHEAEQVGDSHRCAETTVERPTPARFGEDLGWDLGARGRSGAQAAEAGR